MNTTTLARRTARCAITLGLSALLATGALAEEREWPRGHFPLPEAGNVIGENYTVTVQEGDTLVDLARTHNVGYEAIRMANPDVSIWAPFAGTG